MNGEVVIGVGLDTKSFDKQIEEVEYQLKQIDYELSHAKELKLDSRTIKEYELKAEKLTNQLASLRKKQEDLNTTNLSGITSRLDNIGGGVEKVIKKITRWGLALFGIRSMYNFIRGSMSTLSGYNDQLATDVEYIRFVLASTLQPVIERIIQLVYTLLQYINYIAKAWFGVNLFANASTKAFQKNNKEAKKLSKTLASFDEMNILQDNKSKEDSGVGTAPSMDLSKIKKENIFDWVKNKWQDVIDFLENTNWQEVGSNVYKGIKDFFTGTDWGEIADNIFEGLGAAFGAIGGFIVGFLKEAWKDISSYFGEWIEKSKEQGGNIVDGILAGILNAIAQIGIWVYDHVFKPFIDGFKKAFEINSPSKVMEKMGGYIIDGFKNGLLNIWNKVKSIFENLKNNMINVFSSAWQGIKNVFSNVSGFFGGIVNKIKSLFSNIGSTAGNVIAGAFKGVVNGVLRTIENVLNTPIRTINSMINTINKLPGVNIGRLPTFYLPRLAKGGIVNMPGRGINYGGANIGEKAPEAVIPFTDEQVMDRLGQSIARHMVINATITNTMNGRVISREIQRVQNNSNFAMNR